MLSTAVCLISPLSAPTACAVHRPPRRAFFFFDGGSAAGAPATGALAAAAAALGAGALAAGGAGTFGSAALAAAGAGAFPGGSAAAGAFRGESFERLLERIRSEKFSRLKRRGIKLDFPHLLVCPLLGHSISFGRAALVHPDTLPVARLSGLLTHG